MKKLTRKLKMWIIRKIFPNFDEFVKQAFPELSIHRLPGNILMAMPVGGEFEIQKIEETPPKKSDCMCIGCRLNRGEITLDGREQFMPGVLH